MWHQTGAFLHDPALAWGSQYPFVVGLHLNMQVTHILFYPGTVTQWVRAGLQTLYDKYKDKGLEVLGFPCNQFGGQEPNDDAGIQEFCTRNHGVTFPLMKKSDVNGDNTNEVYKWLKSQKSGILGLTRIKV